MNNFISNIENLGVFAYVLTSIVAFGEAFAFVGLLVPGSMIIPPMGFLAFKGYFDIRILIAVAAVGAIAGDVVSFYLGRKGKKFMTHPKLQELLIKGEDFIMRHGGKSVLCARFIGPIRPIVPFAAGVLKMNTKKFFSWSIFSAICWSIFYLMAGYLFGHAWQKIEDMTSKIFFLGFLIIILGSLLYFRRRQYLKNRL